LTVRPTVVVRVRVPLTPVTVTVAAPIVAVAEAVKVRMLLLPEADAGLKAAVTPAGSPLAVSATLAVNPPVRVMFMVLVTLPPWFTATLAGVAESVKFGV
jgi:hypothetical protein